MGNSCFVIRRLTEEVRLRTWDNGKSIHIGALNLRPSSGSCYFPGDKHGDKIGITPYGMVFGGKANPSVKKTG